jgi:hypothetical protein
MARRILCKPMTLNTVVDKTSDITTEDYLVVGVATCFRRDESELEMLKVLEPIPSAYLEALLQGIPTSYSCVMATSVGHLADSNQLANLAGDSDVHLCANFHDRVIAAARTYKTRPAAQALIPTGTSRSDLNYSTEKKRVLNAENIVRAEDNIRQHEYTHKTL